MPKPKWKYINPDERCTYPAEKSYANYCWGYAGAYDKGKKELEKFKKQCCPKCDLFDTQTATGGKKG